MSLPETEEELAERIEKSDFVFLVIKGNREMLTRKAQANIVAALKEVIKRKSQ